MEYLVQYMAQHLIQVGGEYVVVAAVVGWAVFFLARRMYYQARPSGAHGAHSCAAACGCAKSNRR